MASPPWGAPCRPGARREAVLRCPEPLAGQITRRCAVTRADALLRAVLRPEAEDRSARLEVPEPRRVVADALDYRVRNVAREDRADQGREVALRHPRRGCARVFLRLCERQPARALRAARVARVVLRG